MPKVKSKDNYTKHRRREYNVYYREVVMKNKGLIKSNIVVRLPYFQVPKPIIRPSVIYEIVSRMGRFHRIVSSTRNREDIILELVRYADRYFRQNNSRLSYHIFITEKGERKEFLHSNNPSHKQFIHYLCRPVSNTIK